MKAVILKILTPQNVAQLSNANVAARAKQLRPQLWMPLRKMTVHTPADVPIFCNRVMRALDNFCVDVGAINRLYETSPGSNVSWVRICVRRKYHSDFMALGFACLALERTIPNTLLEELEILRNEWCSVLNVDNYLVNNRQAYLHMCYKMRDEVRTHLSTICRDLGVYTPGCLAQDPAWGFPACRAIPGII